MIRAGSQSVSAQSCTDHQKIPNHPNRLSHKSINLNYNLVMDGADYSRRWPAALQPCRGAGPGGSRARGCAGAEDGRMQAKGAGLAGGMDGGRHDPQLAGGGGCWEGLFQAPAGRRGRLQIQRVTAVFFERFVSDRDKE